jgi:hypothetical protein
VFSNSSTNPSGVRNFSINLGIGKASYLPRNGHFMNISQIWNYLDESREDADKKIYYGLKAT